MKYVALPCLRCGKEWAVLIAPFFPIVDRASMYSCKSCEAPHYLLVTRKEHTFAVFYQRYTLGYPLECYDDGEVPPIVVSHTRGHAADTSDYETFYGPIVVYPRKRSFSRSEVETIWQATQGHCHLCLRRWPIAKRGARGWHIDHVIPHIGGGHEVEELPNFRIACAKCNIKKGKGYTEARIRLALRDLVKLLVEADTGR